VPQWRLDDAVLRILRGGFATGAYDHPPVITPIDAAADAAVSQQAAEQALVVLGVDPAIASRSTAVFRQHDDETVEELYTFWKKDEDLTENPTYMAKAKQRVQMFNDALQLDLEAAEEKKDGTKG